MLDEDEWDPSYWSKTTRFCDCCGEGIAYTDELFLLQICTAQMIEGHLQWGPLLFDGEFAFVPQLLHLKCWEDLLEEIREQVQDVPPHDAQDPVLLCTVCESLIGAREAFISSTFCELHVSRRSPSGQFTDCLDYLGKPDPICLECFVHLLEERFENWEDVIYYMPEGYLDEDTNGVGETDPRGGSGSAR